MGGVYRIQTFLDFYIFFIFTRPLRDVARDFFNTHERYISEF